MIGKNSINKIIGKFGVEIHGKGYLQALGKGDFQSNCFKVQQELIQKKHPIIFDIGANRGNITEAYLECFPAASIFAFEPFPESFHHLENRFMNNKNVHCFQNAVASSNGLKEFFVNKNVDTNSLLPSQKSGLRSDDQVRNVSTIRVNSITLDEFCLSQNISHIDILKMDIQGGEYEALKGLHNMLSKSGIDVIYSEANFVELYMGQALFHDIAKFLFGYGYRLQDIYNPIYGNGSIAWADVIFIKNRQLQ